MLQGSITRGLLTIALPIMVMNVTQSLFNLVGMTVLKSFAGDGYAVGAVGACTSPISLITGLLVGCSSGANVVIARHIGAKNRESAERAVGAAMLFSLLGGLFLSAIGITCAELFLTWMNCPAALFSNAVLYFRLYFAGIPLSMIYNFSASILRSTGDSRRPMIYLTVAGALKVVFTVLFVAVFRLSVVGVALATILSWSVSCFLGLRALFTSRSEYIRLLPARLRLYRRELSDVLSIGIPAGLQQALYSIANVIIMASVNSFGPAATTGVSIANNFDGILYNIATAPALAVMPYVSQNLGANDPRRAKRAVTIGMTITVAMAATLGALSAIFSGELSSIMSTDPEVIRFSQQKMIIISSTYFICGINEILAAAMRGLRRPIVPTVSALLYMCVFRFLWVLFIFPLCPNLTFLYLVWPVSWALCILTTLCFYLPTIRGNWRKRFPSALSE